MKIERIKEIIFFTISIVIFINLNFAFGNEWKMGEFINGIGNLDSQFDYDYINLSEEADFWHYSGGYWQTNYYDNNLRIYDYEMQEYLEHKIKKFSIKEVIMNVKLPEELISYLNSGGNSDNIKFILKSEYLDSNLFPGEIYEDSKVEYKIADEKLHIKFKPIFNVEMDKLIHPINGTLNVSIPTIKSKFGFPLFAIWNKNGTSLGNTNIGNIADLPEGHAFLDGKDSRISIDTSEDIMNPQGDLGPKTIGIWNTVPSKYTITQKNTSDYRIGDGTFANGGSAGMKFILPLRMYYPVLEENIPVLEEDIPVIESEDIGIIKAMAPKDEYYDVSLGIPSSENVYAQVLGKERITNHEFEKISGDKDFQVTVTRVYTEKWRVIDRKRSTPDKKVRKTKRRTRTVSQTYSINRAYSYHRINSFENFKIDKAKIYSDVLNNNEIELYPKNYEIPSITLENEENIVSEPPVQGVITLSPKTVGKNGTPSNPNWESIAEASVGEYMVRNDSLIFDSQVIMDSALSEKSTPEPIDLPIVELIGEDVLMEEDLKIPDSVRNKVHENTGEIVYKRDFNYNGTSLEEILQPIAVNTVTVHTPIYSELLMSNVGDDYNQQVGATINDRAIILGMATKFRYQTTGEHRNILGYGNRDYDKYISLKEIKFPFDVYYKGTTREASKYVRKDTWLQVDSFDTDIYVPIWVQEGTYQIEIRSRAINADVSDTFETSLKNIESDYYSVTDEKTVEVIGRLYGFKIRDIDDYPTWEEVFRREKGSYEFIQGNNYPFGGNDENGNVLRRNEKYFLPIAPGSHPTYKNVGGIPLGYKIRFTLETLGNYLKNDEILIEPHFSFVDYLGNEDQNISLWSKVRINNNDYLIDLDNIESNVKGELNYKIDLGNPYITLKEEELESISNHLGVSIFELKKKKEAIGYADKISITKFLRTYIGDDTNSPLEVNQEAIKKARQKWYGEYWLPNDTYAVKEDVNLIEYAAKNNGIDFSEDIFLKDGFIKVNFQMVSKKDPESSGENLTYKNDQTNMYSIEGFNPKKDVYISGENKLFDFEDGDTILYDINRRKSDDYSNYGTH